MPGHKSIVFKLILVITFCSVLIFAFTLGYNYYESRLILEQELENNARNLAMPGFSLLSRPRFKNPECC